MDRIDTRLIGRVRHVRRYAGVLVHDPAEALDRVRNKLELRGDREQGGYVSRDAVRALAATRFGYEAVENPEEALHDLLGVRYPCDARGEFDRAWRQLTNLLGSGHPAGSGLDADRGLARIVFCIALHRRPSRVVETGVARGIQTHVLLRALEANERGGLWSVDLPPLRDEWHGAALSAVPGSWRARWTFLRGSSRRKLPRLLSSLGKIDVFIHDSQHTERNMAFEFALAWPSLSSGGILIADDIHENAAFRDFVTHTPNARWFVGQEEVKDGLYGVALKGSN
jgi:predicted O-methyltransferase YrrM